MKKVILGLVAIAALAACSKDNGNDNSNGNGGFNNNGDPTIEQGTFPKEVITKDQNGKITNKKVFTVQGGKIQSIIEDVLEDRSDKGRSITNIYYNGDLINKVEEQGGFGGDKKILFSYENGKVKKEVTTFNDAPNKPLTKEYFYTNEGIQTKGLYTISMTLDDASYKWKRSFNYADRDYVRNGDLVTVKTRSYKLDDQGAEKAGSSRLSTENYTSKDGNLLKSVEVKGNDTITDEYTYTTHANPIKDFYRILYPEEFFLIPYASNNLPLTHKLTVDGVTGSNYTSEYVYEYNFENGRLLSEKRFKKEGENKILQSTTEYKY